MITAIDNLLNRITMYRLVLYYLLILILAAATFSFFGVLPYSPLMLAFSTLFICIVCWITNSVFAKIFSVATNVESTYITGLILALIITPVALTDYAGMWFLLFASVSAIASKYLLSIRRRHIFNPAAFGVALSALIIGHSATWWVGGNLPLLAFVFIGGVLVMRKTRRIDLVTTFSLVALGTIVVTAPTGNYITPVMQTFLHSPFFFFAFVMLTEPLTMPQNRILRIIYAAIVGFLFAPAIHVGSFYLTPELALLSGNIFSYISNPQGRLVLTLREKRKLATGIYEFIFSINRSFSFRPGQYLEWTLGHQHVDNRGNRRYFTIASSPTEPMMRLGVRFYSYASSYKRALGSMKIGATISASQLSGDFVLPKDPERKIVLIAGGIGVTPFRSMMQYLIDKKELRPIVLLYSSKTLEEVAYREVFDRAEREVGLKTVYVLSHDATRAPNTYNGQIDAALITRQIPDYRERTFYISGPPRMVDAFKKILRDMNISRWRIKTDYFPGLA